MARNPNHPTKGSRITTLPIPEKAIPKIERLLQDNPRDLLLYVLSINNGLRISTILKLKVGQVKDCQVGDTIPILETKTGKQNIIAINGKVYKALESYLTEIGPITDSDYVFKSRKGNNNPLTVPTVSSMVKSWCLAVGLKENGGKYASHSLRKTWGMMMLKKHNTQIGMISLRFQHSSIKITERYLGLTENDIKELLMNEV